MDTKDKLTLLITAAEIESAVKRLAADITRDYRDKNPVLLGVLKGVFLFMADLVRQLDFPLGVDFVRLSSYGSGQQTSGTVKVVHDLSLDVHDRHVLVVEDIVDTGITVAFLIDYIKNKKPASLRLCALMDKPEGRRTQVKIDYTGLTVPDKFLVGYGLDCDEKYRNLPDIYMLGK